RESRSGEKGRGCSECLPDGSEGEASGKRTETLHRGVPSESGRALLVGRQIGDERLLRAFDGSRVDAVDQEPTDKRGERQAPRKSRIDQRVDQPAAGDQRSSSDVVR